MRFVSVTVPIGATMIPVRVLIEPSGCTEEPAGTFAITSGATVPRVVVCSTKLADIILPEAVTTLPGTGFLTVFAGATSNPKLSLIEPSSCTTEFGGIVLPTIVEMRPRGTTGGTKFPGSMLPSVSNTEPARLLETVSGPASLMPEGLKIEPSACTREFAGI
jgi:hypothetical protein